MEKDKKTSTVSETAVGIIVICSMLFAFGTFCVGYAVAAENSKSYSQKILETDTFENAMVLVKEGKDGASVNERDFFILGGVMLFISSLPLLVLLVSLICKAIIKSVFNYIEELHGKGINESKLE